MDEQAKYRLDRELRDLINRNGIDAVLLSLLVWYEKNGRAAERTLDSVKFMLPAPNAALSVDKP
jgi:hypothetical protein